MHWISAISKIVTLLLVAGTFFVSPPLHAKPFHHKFGETREYHKHWLGVCDDSVKGGCRAVTAMFTTDDGFFLHGRLAINQHWQTGDYKIQFIGDLSITRGFP